MTSYSPTKMSSKENLAAVAPETVILHQFPRTQFGPTMSPYALKLETYLRFAKISYANDFSKPKAPSTGKCPWMTYKNEDVADSTICMEFLKRNNVGVDLNANLSAGEKAISRAFQKLVEEELNWVIMLWRWSYDKEETTLKILQAGKLKGFLMSKVVGSMVKKYAHGHGIGRNSPAEVMKIGEDDIRAVGEFLGTKKYIMGDGVSDVDCTLFGTFAQILYISQTCPLTGFVRENYPNIVAYCDHIKSEVWSDWDEICESVKPIEKEKKSLKHTMSTETAPDVVVKENGTTNGHHIEENGHVAHPITNGTLEKTPMETTVIVKETEHTIHTADHGDILVTEVETTMIVEGAQNGHSTNGFHEEANGNAIPAV